MAGSGTRQACQYDSHHVQNAEQYCLHSWPNNCGVSHATDLLRLIKAYQVAMGAELLSV